MKRKAKLRKYGLIAAAGVGVIALLAIKNRGGEDKASVETTTIATSTTVAVPTTKFVALTTTVDLKKKPALTLPGGTAPTALGVTDIVPGTGIVVKPGDQIEVQYVGVAWSTKKQFDASWDRNEPTTFSIGTGAVIKGWDEGLVGMKAGGRRQLVIPGSLAYGPAGRPGSIGPDETLVFVVDMISVNGKK